MKKKKIELANVSFSYQEKKTLSQVSLSAEEGMCLLLCGESGCGKTTITKLLNGIIPHFMQGTELAGQVLIDGEPVSDMKMYQLAARVGSVFQNPKSQFFYLDSDSELAFVLENQGVPGEEIAGRVEETAARLQIEDLLHRSVFAMSGGEKQILAFAAVYAGDPSVYVLDEPSSNLDDLAIERLRRQIQLVRQQGKTVIIAEHRLAYLMDLVDYAVYVKDGEIAEHFTGAEFRQLSEERCLQMGLRSPRPVELICPVEQPGIQQRKTYDLQINGLEIRRKQKTILENLTFGVNYGEILGITGKNGVGKSTLLRCLCGLEKERVGEILLEGKQVMPKERLSRTYLVMQDVNHQLFSESVWDECEAAAGASGESEIEAVLKQFDLFDERERHPLSLSGGQKQRLVLANAVLEGRRILLLDEPTSGLDYRHMKAVSEELRSLADAGYMLLIVTHDREFLNAACDRCLDIGGGYVTRE